MEYIDTLKNLTCPACGCEMTKVFIPDKGINIDVCANGCGGIFLDNQEIQEFSTETDNIEDIKEILAGKNFMPVDETQQRICPSCNTPMVKTSAFGVQIDSCYKCGGIFLDNGEFEQIKKKKKKRPPKTVNHITQNTSGELDVREFYKEAQREKLVDDFTSGMLSALLPRRRRGGLIDVLWYLLR